MSERLRKRIDALRVEYVATFDEEALGFQTEMSAGDRASVARRAHRIGGTAGSYQLDEVSRAAQNVERMCESQDNALASGASEEAAIDEVLKGCINELCELLRAAQLLVLQAAT